MPPPDVQVQTTAPPPPVIQTQSIQATPPRPAPAPVISAPAPVVQAAPAPTGPTQGVRPRAKLQQVFGDPANYPDASLRAEESGTTGFTVMVDETGSIVPGSCAVTSSSGHERLDKAACTVLERNRRKLFEPALDNGKPIQATFRSAFRWVVPK